ncbi:MAG: T9SS type A sorting domain-containing protein [Elusimicrobia bacterium]|nr:T9SS type A sorting domain-containing protein [Elusimicrobiota bacterium]
MAGEPELALASQVPGITIHHVSTVTVNPAVAIATSAAAVQGLILAGNLFDILSPDPSLPGGATLNFRYQDLGSDALEQELRVYRFDTAVSMWQLAADVGPDTANNLFSVPLNHLSLFAVLLKDRIAPVTSLNLLEGPKFVSTSGQVFISSQTTHILSASDRPLGKLAGSGVLGTEFRIDTTVAPFEPYVAGFALAFPTEGFHTIQFRSFDLAHNTEPIKSASLGTDATSPAISLASIEPNVLLPGGLAVRGQTASVLIKASDPIKESVASGVSSLSFGLNQTTSSFVVGSSATITLGPGVHQLRVIALDNVGNARNQVFTIVAGDELPPRTVLSEGSPKFTAIDNAELVSSAVTLDQSAFPVTFVSPQSLMVLSSIDDFRQTGDSQGVGVSSIIVGLDGLFSSTFTNPSPAIGQTFVASFNFVGVPDSVYSFRFAGIDVLGQTETLSTRTIAIDSLPPLTRLVASRPLFMENGMLYATSKDTFAFVATDNLSGIERITFKIDDGPDQVFTGEPFSIAQEGTHVVSFNAVDRLGHQEGLQQATIVIDNSPPTFSGTNTVLVQAEDPKNILAGIEAAGGLARLITTTITVFSPENIVWNMGFEGDSLPGSDPQFAVFKRDANISESVQDGIYKVSFTGPVPRDPVQYILSMFSTGVNASVGFTVELRVRAVDDAGMFVSIFAPQVDSTLGISVTPFSREVFMRPRFGQLFFPNIDPREFHVYRLVYRPDNVFKLFVDGMETVVSDYKDPAASFGQQIDNRLRGANFSISGSVEIDYIRVNNQEAREPPPPTIELAGSLAGTVETPFIEFTEVTKINNFQSVENPREGNIVHEFSTDGFNYRPVADLGNADPSSKKVKFRSTLSRNSLAEVSPELDSFSFELKRQVLTTVRAINPTKSKFGINFISSERLIAMPTVTVSGIQAVDGNTPPSFLWNFTATTRPDDPEGIHAIRIEGQDLAGNTGTDETGSIAFDATNPAISVQSPLAGQVYVAAISSIPIEFAVSDLDPNPVISAQLVQVENRGLLRGPTVLTVIAGDRINPLSIDDGIWSFTVSVQDWALNVSSAATEPFEVIHDILAPRTSLAIGAPKIPAFELSAPPSPDPITFVTKQTTFTFSSIDDLVISGDNQGLGVATQTVSVNGVIRSIFVDPSPNQGQSFISQLLLSGDTDGIYAVGFFAEDVIGNKETVQTTTVAVDNSHPLTSVHISGPQFKAIGDVPDAVGGPLFIATHSLISLDAVDPIVNGVASGLQETKFSIDGGAFEVFAASFTLPEGKRTVLITSKDRLNNEEPVKTVEASVDQTPPQTLVSYIGPAAFPDHPADAQPSDVGAFITGDTKIALSAQDPVTQEVASGVKEIKYRINGGEFLVYSGSFTLPSQGVYLIEYFAKDRVDNAEASRFLKVAVDNTAPETSLAVGQPLFEAFGETFITPETPIALSAVDPLVNNAASGLQEILFAVDQTPMAVYSSTFTLAQGTHTVSFLAKDRLGNTEVMQKKIFHVSALLQHALVTGQGASDLDGNVRIEGSVASSGAFTANGNPVSVSSVIASSIRLVGNAVIEGDAILTAGTTDQIELTGNASIKGSRLVNTALAPHPSPIDLAVLLSNISQSNNNHLIPSQYLVNGSLVVKDQTLTLTTGQYLINGLEVAGNGEIKVQGPVALFVRGAIIWEGNAAVNSLGESGNLVIVSTSSTFLAKGNVEAAAFVYAPLSAASIDGNVRLAGHAYFASASIKGNPILYATDGLLPPKEGSNQNNAGNDDGGSKKTASLASAPSQFGPDPAFKLGEAYAYPNPAAGGARPIIHIETGMADSARILIYSISGELVQETNLSGQPQVIDDGQGPQYAYEWGWDGHIPSGTYFYLVEAKKDSEVLRAKGKFYVIR